jgi:hypothetical protein
MKRESQPKCFGSNQPNISVGRSTHAGNPVARTSSSWARLVRV